MKRTPESVPLDKQQQMKQYLIFRLLITVLGFLLVTFYLACLSPAVRGTVQLYLYLVLGCYLVVGVVSLVTFRRWRALGWFFRQQVTIDFVLQALLIWSTGGVLSIFSPILFVTLAAATCVASPRGSFVLASLATLFLGSATVAYALGWIPATSSWSAWVFSSERSIFIASYLLASVLALYAISTLGSKLSHGLRQVKHLQEEIIENMEEGVLAVDRDGRVVHLNGEARKLLGLTGLSSSYRNKHLKEILAIGAETHGNHDAYGALREAFAQGGRRRLEVTLLGDDGRQRDVEARLSSVFDEKDRFRCRIGLFSDLSLKRDIEAAERRIQKLEELQVMALGIAHEIRNPLASIRGCVQEISRRATHDEEQKSFSGIVMRESDRLDRIIEDFLRFARTGPIDLVPLQLRDLIDEAVTLLQNHQSFGRRTLLWNPPASLPKVWGGRDSLLQVFLNLGINSIEATCEESGQLGVEVHAVDWPSCSPGGAEAPRGVEVVFWDNGKGITDEHVRKVFNPFFSTKHTGSGLGLSIVERIIQEHKGSVEIEPRPEGGTRVRVRLPCFSTATNGSLVESNRVHRDLPEVTCNA